MQLLDGAIRLDFFNTQPARTPPQATHSRIFALTLQQRAAQPYPHQTLVLSTVGTEDTQPVEGATLTLGPFHPRLSGSGTPDETRYSHLLIALTNAKPGQEAKFDDWYWNQHFPDGLRLPGCFAGRRYQLAQGTDGPYQHLAIYQFDLPDISAAVSAVAARSGTPEMPMTDAISNVFQAWFVKPDSGWS